MGNLEDVGVDDFQFVGILVAFGKDGLVELNHIGFLGELTLQVGESLVEGFVGHIEDDAECKHVAALVGSLLVSTLFLTDAGGERGDGGLDDGVGVFHLVGEGVLLVAGLLHSFVGEGVDVDNNGSTFLSPFQIGLEGCGVHGHEDVTLVTRAIDMVSHMNLITRDTGDGVVRGADFSRIVGESGDVVSRQGRGVGEESTRQLHSVTGIAGETDDEVVFINYLII